MSQHYSITDVSELDSLAEIFLREYPEPRAFALIGAMGVGKTTFVNAVCRRLGINNTSSPTFGLVNEYESDQGVKVFHFDLYRTKSIQEVLDIGIEEYLSSTAYVFIEWPQIIYPYFQDDLIPIKIEETSQGRSFQF